MLADPLLQKLLLLRPSDEAYQRVAHWLHAILEDVISGNADEDTLWDMLDVVRDFATQTKVCEMSRSIGALLTFFDQILPPVLLNFFVRFFELWDGTGRSDCLFDILSYAPLHDFQGQWTVLVSNSCHINIH